MSLVHRLATRRWAVLSLALSPVVLAAAETTAPVATPVQGVLTLNATATVDVPQDWMMLTLSVNREGTDAGAVQTQLKQAVDAAVAEARRVAKPGQVEIQTGAFSVQPRYNQKGQLNGWQGRTELTIEGREMATIAQLSGRISSMTIARVEYGLSREAREKVEGEVSAQAVARFRARAGDLAKQFGYGGYAIREVNVSTDGAVVPPPMPYARAGMMKAESADMALPTEPGKGSVTANVSGSVQMK
ncbi:MAG TPA: SIMPL domain-containing protein [Ideonella sp.]|uniref:SIMPL domain-containing protein n=1 Tax=Ideonella sp. TaxID=1929293 RepID=UPI002E36F124|nr:SIMPL domain-containing protein [Ideonella sp.]HEX5685389.1 SIMPL domain-containing protein [Ideonella sp.]